MSPRTNCFLTSLFSLAAAGIGLQAAAQESGPYSTLECESADRSLRLEVVTKTDDPADGIDGFLTVQGQQRKVPVSCSADERFEGTLSCQGQDFLSDDLTILFQSHAGPALLGRVRVLVIGTMIPQYEYQFQRVEEMAVCTKRDGVAHAAKPEKIPERPAEDVAKALDGRYFRIRTGTAPVRILELQFADAGGLGATLNYSADVTENGVTRRVLNAFTGHSDSIRVRGHQVEVNLNLDSEGSRFSGDKGIVTLNFADAGLTTFVSAGFETSARGLFRSETRVSAAETTSLTD